MEVRYSPDIAGYKTLRTDEIRRAFLMEDLFEPGQIRTLYFDIDRAIVGGALPTSEPLPLVSSKKEMAAEYFAERREIGIFNVGGSGRVRAGEEEFVVEGKDAVYIGKGTKEVVFSSTDPAQPAYFYFVSYPAHASHPSNLIKHGKVFSARLGSQKEANMRTINRYIHPGGVRSSQLVMGLTELDEGSIWNTMPAHTHQRRTEIYFYFNIDRNAAVFHLMGEPSETRHIVVRDKQAVISPSWSIHSGAGTGSYSFIWAMGGENQTFEDMDNVEMHSIK